jgi:hypothetical protein
MDGGSLESEWPVTVVLRFRGDDEVGAFYLFRHASEGWHLGRLLPLACLPSPEMPACAGMTRKREGRPDLISVIPAKAGISVFCVSPGQSVEGQ